MSYFPCDIPFMSEDEKKKNGIKCNSDVDKDINVPSNDTISRQAAIDALMEWEESSVWDEDCIKHRGEPYWVAPSDVIEQLPSAQPDNQVNLCDSCTYQYPDCPSKPDDVIFGNGKGNDNICACNKYRPISAQPEREKGKWIVNETLINCSVCKHSAWSRHAFEDIVRGFNFCPNCGKPMKRGKQDER